MRFLVSPGDRGGCGHYRLIWPAEALAAQGHDVRVLGEKDNLCRGYYGANDVLVDIDPPDADVVVLQRVLKAELLPVIVKLQEAGIAVVVEVDDDFTRIDSRNSAYRMSQPEHSPESNYAHLLEACALADLVTVSTPALARRFAPHGRVAVLENCVPVSYLDEPGARFFANREWRPGKKARIGWSGSVATHPGDLETTAGAVQRVVGGLAEFCVIGSGLDVRDALRLVDAPQKTGWVKLAEYPRALAQLDIGIVPLKASAFNRAKSWLKGLEMAAVGVPFVATPNASYSRLAKLGAGVLADKPKDWERHLGLLIRNPSMRAELAAAGREVAKEWTIERNAYRWLAAWTEAATIRKAA